MLSLAPRASLYQKYLHKIKYVTVQPLNVNTKSRHTVYSNVTAYYTSYHKLSCFTADYPKNLPWKYKSIPDIRTLLWTHSGVLITFNPHSPRFGLKCECPPTRIQSWVDWNSVRNRKWVESGLELQRKQAEVLNTFQSSTTVFKHK